MSLEKQGGDHNRNPRPFQVWAIVTSLTYSRPVSTDVPTEAAYLYISPLYLTCLTCAGYSVLLFALPSSDGHVVDGDVSLEAGTSDSFKHNLCREETKKPKTKQ